MPYNVTIILPNNLTSGYLQSEFINSGDTYTSNKYSKDPSLDNNKNTLSAGDLSPNLQLKVYLPNGLDTVKAPVYVDMYFVSSDSNNDVSVYSASYTFYKQGRYNNIDFVDGFMYFDVHCPLTVQKSIPFQFDFQLL